MRTLTEIILPERLKYLVTYCEKNCVAECCGIDAFDFSPLHVASCISAYTGRISDSDIADWEQELTKAEELTRDLAPNEDGYICAIAGMNQCFRREDFRAFIAELRHSIQVSPGVLEFRAAKVCAITRCSNEGLTPIKPARSIGKRTS